MNSKEIENKMRSKEYFHSLKVPEDQYIILRVDGRAFSKLTSNMNKPYDYQFHFWMASIASVLMEEFVGEYAYTQSDEVSILLPKDFDMFNRSVEKLVSVSASISARTVSPTLYGSFDSRIWMSSDLQDVNDYFSWRETDAARNCINSYVYWTARKEEGLNYKQATKENNGRSNPQKHDYLMSHGINFADLPSWQKNGTGIKVVSKYVDGQNPLDGTTNKTKRYTQEKCNPLELTDYRTRTMAKESM